MFQGGRTPCGHNAAFRGLITPQWLYILLLLLDSLTLLGFLFFFFKAEQCVELALSCHKSVPFR